MGVLSQCLFDLEMLTRIDGLQGGFCDLQIVWSPVVACGGGVGPNYGRNSVPKLLDNSAIYAREPPLSRGEAQQQSEPCQSEEKTTRQLILIA
jgi:hypothetical protein